MNKSSTKPILNLTMSDYNTSNVHTSLKFSFLIFHLFIYFFFLCFPVFFFVLFFAENGRGQQIPKTQKEMGRRKLELPYSPSDDKECNDI